MIGGGSARAHYGGNVAVLFDLDGTLLELPVAIEPTRAAVAALFAARGVVLEMRPLLERIEEAATLASSEAHEQRELVRAAWQLIGDAERVAAARARPRPGASVVATLAARGVLLGIVTNNGRACVAPALAAAGIEAAFTVCMSRDDAPAPKPDGRGLASAIEQLVVHRASREPLAKQQALGETPKEAREQRKFAALAPPRDGGLLRHESRGGRAQFMRVWYVGDSWRDAGAVADARRLLPPEIRLELVAVTDAAAPTASARIASLTDLLALLETGG